MSVPAESEPLRTSSVELAGAGPAGLGPGERDLVAARYRLLEPIAEGGMGAVYRAEHVLSRKKLAVKIVHPYLCKGRQGVERFRREVSAAAEIDHPGIVQVYDAGVDDDGGFFMAMELLAGESLGDLLRRDWPGMARAVRLVEGMLEPLAKAHAKGFVHRDLKPDNVYLALDEEGRERVKILDFGLAREVSKSGATRTGVTFGTPEYMSPEQAMSARKVRAPGDVWSVGVMLYELLSGEHPFGGETPHAIMANAIKEPLPPLVDRAPHVPRPLAALIERCLEKQPEQRPEDAGRLLIELRAVLTEVELDDTVPSAPSPPPAWQDSEEEDARSDAAILSLRRRRPAAASVEVTLGELEPTVPPSARRARLLALVAAGAALSLAGVGAAAYLALRAPPAMLARELEPAAREEAASSEPPTREPAPAVRELAPVRAPAAPEPAVVAPAPASPVADAVADAVAAAPVEPAPVAGSAESERRAARRRVREEAEEPADAAALQEAREHLGRNDRAGARSVLEQRGRSATEQALLIHIYREQGATELMLRRMQSFVQRWPRASETPGFRADLQRYGLSP